MQPTLSFLARVPDGQGNFPFVKVQSRRGQPVPIPGATSFYLRYRENGKRVILPLGNDLAAAYSKYTNRVLNAERQSLGLPVTSLAPERRAILSALSQYVDEMDKLDRPRKTIHAYRNTVESFCRSTSKTDMEQIDRTDIINYIGWLRRNLTRHHINGKLDGERNTTIINRLRYLRAFLLRFGTKIPLPEKDWPKATRKNPDRYLLNGHATYRDIRRGKINVHDKPQYNFKVKDREQRPVDIPLPGWFLKRMDARRARRPKTELIFPAQMDASRPNHHLLKDLKTVAKRAGLDCNATLHKFRRTFGTLMAKKFGVRQAQAMLGHSKIETTMAYLAADEMDTAEAQAGIEEIFAPVGD